MICLLLQMLDLSRNQLNGFDESIAIKLHKIHDVYLNNNPIICDKCHMGLLIDLAASVKSSLTLSYMCDSVFLHFAFAL